MTMTQLPSGNDPSEIGQLGHWNWGAFLITGFWGLGNLKRGYGAVLFLFFMFSNVIARSNQDLSTPIILIQLVVCLFMGLKGNDLTWSQRPYDSVEHFKKQRRNWSIGGVVCFLIIFGLCFVAQSVPGQ